MDDILKLIETRRKEHLLILNDAIGRFDKRNDKVIIKTLLVTLAYIKDFKAHISLNTIVETVYHNYRKYYSGYNRSHIKEILNDKNNFMMTLINGEKACLFEDVRTDYYDYYDELDIYDKIYLSKFDTVFIEFNKVALCNFLYVSEWNYIETPGYYSFDVNDLVLLPTMAHIIPVYCEFLRVINGLKEKEYKFRISSMLRITKYNVELKTDFSALCKKFKYEVLKKLVKEINAIEIGIHIDIKDDAGVFNVKITNNNYEKELKEAEEAKERKEKEKLKKAGQEFAATVV